MMWPTSLILIHLSTACTVSASLHPRPAMPTPLPFDTLPTPISLSPAVLSPLSPQPQLHELTPPLPPSLVESLLATTSPHKYENKVHSHCAQEQDLSTASTVAKMMTNSVAATPHAARNSERNTQDNGPSPSNKSDFSHHNHAIDQDHGASFKVFSRFVKTMEFQSVELKESTRATIKEMPKKKEKVNTTSTPMSTLASPITIVIHVPDQVRPA